jgi:hypothetical protein
MSAMIKIDNKRYERHAVDDKLLADRDIERLPPSPSPSPRMQLHHYLGGFFIVLGIITIVAFSWQGVSPSGRTVGMATARHCLIKRVDKGTVRLSMIALGAMGINTAGTAISSATSAVAQGLAGGFVTLISGIGLATSGTAAASKFFGYRKRGGQDVHSIISINGVTPLDTAAWENIHQTYGVRFPFLHNELNTSGWVMFHPDQSVTAGTIFNYTVEATNSTEVGIQKALEKRESGCVATDTCDSGSSQAEIIMNFNNPGGAAPADEEWDNDDWTQLAQSIVDQLAAGNGDKADFEIDNPFGIVLTGNFEVDAA